MSVERKYVTRRSGNYGRFPSGRQHGKHATYTGGGFIGRDTTSLLEETFNFPYAQGICA